MHCHLQSGSRLAQACADAEALVDAMDEAGVDAAVVSGIVGSLEEDNDTVEAACERYPGRLYGYVNLDPRDANGSLAELERRSESPCFRGVKLHSANHCYFPWRSEWFPIYERVEEAGLPVLWHSGTYPNSLPLQIAAVARSFPAVPFILAHFGLADVARDCLPSAELAPTVFVDMSINPILPVMREYVDRVGAGRLLWGSDFPLYSIGYELAKLDHLGCTADERDLIAGGNAQRLFRLDEAGQRARAVEASQGGA